MPRSQTALESQVDDLITRLDKEEEETGSQCSRTVEGTIESLKFLDSGHPSLVGDAVSAIIKNHHRQHNTLAPSKLPTLIDRLGLSHTSLHNTLFSSDIREPTTEDRIRARQSVLRSERNVSAAKERIENCKTRPGANLTEVATACSEGRVAIDNAAKAWAEFARHTLDDKYELHVRLAMASRRGRTGDSDGDMESDGNQNTDTGTMREQMS